MNFKRNKNRKFNVGQYETYKYVTPDGKESVALYGEIWVAEDEFINSTTGAEWKKLRAEIEAAKKGQKTKLIMKKMNNKNYFRVANIIAPKEI